MKGLRNSRRPEFQIKKQMLFHLLRLLAELAFLLVLLLDFATLLCQFLDLLVEGFAFLGFFLRLAFEIYALLFLSLDAFLRGRVVLAFSQGALFRHALRFDLFGLCQKGLLLGLFLPGLRIKLFFLGQ